MDSASSIDRAFYGVAVALFAILFLLDDTSSFSQEASDEAGLSLKVIFCPLDSCFNVTDSFDAKTGKGGACLNYADACVGMEPVPKIYDAHELRDDDSEMCKDLKRLMNQGLKPVSPCAPGVAVGELPTCAATTGKNNASHFFCPYPNETAAYCVNVTSKTCTLLGNGAVNVLPSSSLLSSSIAATIWSVEDSCESLLKHLGELQINPPSCQLINDAREATLNDSNGNVGAT